MNPDDLKTLISICLWTLDGSDDDALSSMANDLDTTVEDLKWLRSTLSSITHPRHPAPIRSEIDLHLTQISTLLALARTHRDAELAATRKAEPKG